MWVCLSGRVHPLGSLNSIGFGSIVALKHNQSQKNTLKALGVHPLGTASHGWVKDAAMCSFFFFYIKAVSLKTLSWNSKTCCLISLQFINEQQVRGTAKQNQRSGRSSKHIDHWWPQTVRQTQNFVLVQEKGGSKFRAKIRPNLYTVNHPLGIMIIIFLFNLEGNKRLYRSCQNKSWNGRRRELCVLKLTLSVPVLLMYRLIVGATDSVCCLCSSQMQSAQ